MKILAINPGSTSTKVALYEDDRELFSMAVRHDRASLPRSVFEQLPIRAKILHSFLEEQHVDLWELSAVVGRGGPLPPIKSGGYLVGQAMLEALHSDRIPPHASILGALLAHELAQPLGIPAYIYDAISACSLSDMARITGFPEIRREAKCHVLNSRATARKAAEKRGRRYEDMRFVVAHLGGGISVSAHIGGEVVDVSSDDDGAFSPERSGGVPLLDVVELCYSGKYTREEMRHKVRGEGGLRALLGTTECAEIEERIQAGDAYAKLVYEAQAYQIVKGIGVIAAAMRFDVDCIILTGGMAYSKMLTDDVRSYVEKIAPVEVWPGENEMEALALGAYRILKGEEIAREYKGAEL